MKLNSTGSKIIESDLKNGSLICFLLGAPGIGKSAIMRDIAERNGWGYHELLCNQIAMQADLTGCRTITCKNRLGEEVSKQVFFPHAVIREAIDEAKEFPEKKVLLFLDEINRTSASVTSAVLTFITARTIGTEKLPDNIIISAAGNDEGNIIALDQASLSRFIVRRCEPDVNTFLKLGLIHPAIATVLKSNPSFIFQREKKNEDDADYNYGAIDNDFEQLATPRTIMGLNKALLDNQKMISDMGEATLKEYVRGFTGDTQFTDSVVTAIMSQKYSDMITREKVMLEKPKNLEKLMAEKNIVQTEALIKAMKEKEKSALLLYMIFDPDSDYTALIRQIGISYKKSSLLIDEMQKLSEIINGGKYNRDSYEALVSLNTPLSKTIKMIYGG